MITSEWPVAGSPQGGLFIKQQVDSLRSAGVETEVFHFQGKKNPVIYWRAMTAVRELLRRQQFDLVHAQFGQSGLLAFPKRVPLVVTFHGSDVIGVVNDSNGKYTLYGKLLSRISRWVASRADAVIVVARHLIQRLPKAKPIHVVPCGIDLDLFRCIPKSRARLRLDWPLDERLVLFAANPKLAVKRFPLAERSVQILNRSVPARLVTASGVPYRDMPYYMNACDALVLTSMHEGSPCVVKEALACNLPVVSVAVGDVAERLAGIDSCRLCADDSPGTIAKDLEQVLLRKEPANSRDAIRPLD
jgi:glycosyltransferase involved in cell wall biosynthesis